MNRMRQITRVAALTAAAALVLSGCTSMLPWPDPKPTGTQSAPRPTPSTKPKPTVKATDAPKPPTDAIFHPYGPADAWMRDDYVNGVAEPMELGGSLCYVSEDYTMLLESIDGVLGLDRNGDEIFSIEDARCAISVYETGAEPVVILDNEVAEVDMNDGSTTTVVAGLEDYSYPSVFTVTEDGTAVVYLNDYDSPPTLSGYKAGKQVWTMKAPVGKDTYLRCSRVNAKQLGCHNEEYITVLEIATGKVVHQVKNTGDTLVSWGTDWYGIYDDDYKMTAFDFTGAELGAVSPPYLTPDTGVFFPYSDLKGLTYGSSPEAITSTGDTAATYAKGVTKTPGGGKLGPSSSYVRAVSADGRVFLMRSDDKTAVVASNGSVLANLDGKDSMPRITSGILTGYGEDYTTIIVWMPLEP